MRIWKVMIPTLTSALPKVSSLGMIIRSYFPQAHVKLALKPHYAASGYRTWSPCCGGCTPNLLHRQHFRLHKLQEAVRHASTSKPPAPSASSSLHKLREAVRHVATRKRKTPGQIKAWLETQDAYTMHRPVRKRFPRNQYTVNNIDEVWEIDIMDLSTVKKYNDIIGIYCR